jgi:PilZ domain
MCSMGSLPEGCGTLSGDQPPSGGMILRGRRTHMNLITSEPAAPAALPTNGSAILREHPRFSLAAEADVTALHNGCHFCHLLATISELGPRGCYLSTPDAFSVGTQVRLCIRHAGGSCELPGRVIYVHKGWGMGILFGQPAAEQSDVLNRWLARLKQTA